MLSVEPETAAQAINRKSAVKECFGRRVELASNGKPSLYVLLQVALDERRTQRGSAIAGRAVSTHSLGLTRRV